MTFLKRKLQIVVAVIGCMTLQACAAIDEVSRRAEDAYLVDSSINLPNSKIFGDHVRPEPFDLDKGVLLGEPEGTPPAILRARAPVGAAEAQLEYAKSVRNALTEYLILRSDRLCESHIAGIAAVSSSVDFSLNEAATLLTTAGALVTGEQAAKILSGIAGVATATNSHFKQSFYQNMLLPAILNAIRSKRTELLGKLQAELDAKTVIQYPIERAISDVASYHNQCSFVEGVTQLNNTAARSATSPSEREEKIAKAKSNIADLSSLLKKTTKLAGASEEAIAQLRRALEAAIAELASLYSQSSSAPPAGSSN